MVKKLNDKIAKEEANIQQAAQKIQSLQQQMAQLREEAIKTQGKVEALREHLGEIKIEESNKKEDKSDSRTE